MSTMRGGRHATPLVLAIVAGVTVLWGAAAEAAQPVRVRVVRTDSTNRDSIEILRVRVNGDAIERMIRELLASKELEQTIAYAWREAATGQKSDTRKLKELSDQLGEIARRNAGLMTTIQMQCANEGPLPEGFLGVSFDQQSISQRDNEPAVFELGAIESVEPGSPAEKAGIKNGDVLLSIGGVDARKPIALGTILKPGARVQVRLQRGKVTRDVSVLVEKRPAAFGSDCATVERLIRPERDAPLILWRSPALGSAGRAARAPEPGMPPDLPSTRPGGGFVFDVFTPMAMSSNVIAGATMRSLDDDWRESLGVDNGVLVISVAQGSPAKEAGLRGSDVIISADGQAVSSVRALSRIMNDAKANALKLQVIRAGKTQTLTLRWRER